MEGAGLCSEYRVAELSIEARAQLYPIAPLVCGREFYAWGHKRKICRSADRASNLDLS